MKEDHDFDQKILDPKFLAKQIVNELLLSSPETVSLRDYVNKNRGEWDAYRDLKQG